jgi:hypothetical protein
MYFSPLQAMYFSPLQAMYFSPLQAMYFSPLQAVCFSPLQAMYFSPLQAVYFSPLQAVYFSPLQVPGPRRPKSGAHRPQQRRPRYAATKFAPRPRAGIPLTASNEGGNPTYSLDRGRESHFRRLPSWAAELSSRRDGRGTRRYGSGVSPVAVEMWLWVLV